MWFSPIQLHIPDGFLSTPVAVVGWVLALLFITVAIRQTRDQLGDRQVPLMGILAAFIFAAQAINFPIAAGTSGHLLGGALVAILLGPWAATLIMTAVIAMQGLLFQDGGLLVMGWNILNMGVITAFVGIATYSFIRRLTGDGKRSHLAAAFTGAWLSVEIAALATALQLAVSGTSPIELGLPAMAGVHALIGIGEGMITVGALILLETTSSGVLAEGEGTPDRRGANAIAVGLLLALIVALFSPLASSHPDGLEFVAEQKGFLDLAIDPSYEILPDYTVPIISNPVLTTIVAVVLGTLLVFVVAWFVGRNTTRSEPAGD
jgi:cobalt/nickel transport system permease protein